MNELGYKLHYDFRFNDLSPTIRNANRGMIHWGTMRSQVERLLTENIQMEISRQAVENIG